MLKHEHDLPKELLMTCPPDSYSDYCAIVNALEKGSNRDEILAMPEVFRWPKTYRWLADHLKQ